MIIINFKHTIKKYLQIFLIAFTLPIFCGLGCSGGGGGSESGSNNKPPVITAPNSVDLSYKSSLDVTLEITDPENNPVNISWSVIKQPENGDLSLNAKNNFKTVSLTASVIGEYRIRAEVSDGTNSVVKDITVIVKDLAPSYSSLRILPEQPHADSFLNLEIVDLFDPEEEDLIISYHWYINTKIVADENQNTLSPLLFKRGDTVTVDADISDGIHSVQTTPLSIVIGNSPPRLGNLSFSPNSPNTTDDIEVILSSVSDADEDNVAISFVWDLNGKLISGISSNILPAGTAKKGDLVTVVANVTDGFESVSSSPFTCTIADAPVSFIINGLPNEIPNGNLMKFNVVANDPDEGELSVEMAYGPSTMTIDTSGHATWTPNEIMLLPEETFNFGIKTLQSESALAHYSVTVVDDTRKLPISRSGIEVPYKNYSMWVDDYDNDGKNEILLTDSYNLVFTLEFNGQEYVQDWLYPFATSNKRIVQVLSNDINMDGNTDIIIIAEDGVSIISDLTKPAESVFSSDQDTLLAAAIDDIDNDSELEITLLLKDSDNSELLVYQLNNWSLEFSKKLTGTASSLDIGNVDTDTALEIVIDNGYVFDGLNGSNDWYYPNGFGSRLAVGDIDNSGIDVIMGTSGWSNPKIFSAINKSELWEINNSDICTVNILDVDKDPQEEIIIGNCQWGDVTVYDGSTGAAVQQAQWGTVEHASISVTAGDVDNDNNMEVIWGSGITSTGEDVLVVGELTPTVEIGWYNQNPSQLGSFVAAGWSSIVPGNEQAVFVVPNTDSGYGGQRIVTLDETGTMSISEEISTNWDNARYGKVVDYDKDGYAEIFLATSHLYDGEFQVRQLNDNSLEWGGSGGEYSNNIGGIEYADMNIDGHEDAIVIDGYTVNIYDIYNKTVIWNSTSFNSPIYDIAIVAAGTGKASVVVAAENGLSIWTKDVGDYIRKETAVVGCDCIQTGDLNGDNSVEVICLTHDSSYYPTQSNFRIFNQYLQEQTNYTISGNVTEFILEQTDSKNKNLLAGYIPDPRTSYSDANNSALALISSYTGDLIWQSYPLLNSVPLRSLYYIPTQGNANKRLTFSTLDAMYITQ